MILRIHIQAEFSLYILHIHKHSLHQSILIIHLTVQLYSSMDYTDYWGVTGLPSRPMSDPILTQRGLEYKEATLGFG